MQFVQVAEFESLSVIKHVFSVVIVQMFIECVFCFVELVWRDWVEWHEILAL